MDAGVERDRTVEWPGGGSGALTGRGSSTGASPGGTTALWGRRRITAEGSPGEGTVAARQRDDGCSSGSAAWELGQDLVDKREYERAAECFRRMLLPADPPVDRLSVEAAEVAAQLCTALEREQSLEKKLRDACRVLGRDPSRLGHEEVGFARGVLAACVEEQPDGTRHASSALTTSEATGTTARRGMPPIKAPVHAAGQHRLRVRFFGRFELLRDGEVVPLGRNARALAILKYLLARRGDRPVPQDHLMGWLWPESDPKRARWSLNSAVCALRKSLSRCLPASPPSEAILFEGGGYRLSPRFRCSVDTEEFDSHYEKGLRLEKAARAPEAVAEYEKAAELYRGDYLTEDLYEEWTMTERERLVEACTDLLRRLAVHHLRTGQPRESVRACYRVLEKDRCDEQAHRLLMECFVRLGQRGRALRQYGLCEQALRHEYELAPSPETQTLYASILKGGAPR